MCFIPAFGGSIETMRESSVQLGGDGGLTPYSVETPQAGVSTCAGGYRGFLG